DAQIERYGRQILLPEVGGRGQERLLAARVAVAGAGPAAVAAVTLLGRAGVGRLHVSARVGPLPELSPDCRLHRDPTSIEGPLADVAIRLLDLASVADDTPAHGVPFGLEQASRPFVLGLIAGDRLLVATLVGRPCMRCWGQALAPGELGADRAVRGAAQVAPARLALGALAANEVLRVLLSPPVHGRLTTIGVESAPVEVRPVPRPTFYERRTSRGTPMARIATVRGSHLLVCPSTACGFSVQGTPCRFCVEGARVPADREAVPVADVLEVVRAAFDEGACELVYFNTSHY